MIRALVLTDPGQPERMRLWQQVLAPQGCHEIAVNVASPRERATWSQQLDGYQVAIVDAAAALPSPAGAEALGAFVRRGGGCVWAGLPEPDAAEARRALDEPLGLASVASGQPARATELGVAVAGRHDITRRLDATFIVHDQCLLLDEAPPEAEVLLRTTWQFREVPLAWLRRLGAGWVFQTSLGTAEATLRHPVMRQVLFRAARAVAGWREGAPIGVAMIGYGAIGIEHGQALRATDGLELALVCDRSPARLEAAQQAFAGVRTTTASEAVERDDGIGAVIVCTPPNTHAAVAARMLEAGKHVVVEKPFCLTTREADGLIALATERNLALSVYQNRRWDPDFVAIQQAVQAGELGDLFHLETFIGGFAHPCGFWHSHEPISGGVFYDWGSHYLDWVLQLVPDEVTDVRASTHKRVWHDVTNADQATLALRFAGGQEATFIHSDIAALLKPKWYLLGTRGALVGHWRHETVTTRAWSGDLIEERLAPAEALPVLTLARRADDGRIHEQRLSLPPAPVHPFHRNLADHLLAGEPLAINPISSRRNIAVMEAAVSSAAHDAAVVPIASEHD